MLNVVKANFSALRKLSVSDRLSAFYDDQGKIVFSALTPTQFAELFPRYYRENLPDISGFMKALPSSVTAARQKYYEEAIRNTAAGSKEGKALKAWSKNYSDANEAEQKAYVHRKGEHTAPQPPASFTPEEQKAWDNLQKGPITADSADAKALSSLSGEVLSKYGIQKYKDEKTGQEMFRYNQPQATREEAEKALKQGAAGSAGAGPNAISNANMAKQIYDYLREKGIDHNHAAGILANIQRESKFNPGAYNSNDVNGPSGGLFQHHSKFSEGSGGRFNDMVKYVGGDWRSNWRKQIDFALGEGEMKKYLRRQVNSVDEAQEAFVQDFEKPRDSSGAASYNRRFISSIESVVSGTAVKPEGPNGQYSDKQVADMQEKIKHARTDEQKQGLMRQLTEMHRSRGEAVPGMGERVSVSGQSVGKEHTGKWDSLHLYKGGTSTGMCARGVVQVTKQLFAGNKFFDSQGVEGHGDAYQHKNGSFFTSSGLYNPSRPMTDDEIAMAKERPPRLPPGAVVVMGGGKKGYIGHIQIMGNGQWLSDHRQKRFYAPGEGGGAGRSAWSDAYIILPNERGQQQLAENGFAAPPTTPPTTRPSADAAPTYTPPNAPEEYSPVPNDVSGMSEDTRGTEQVKPLHEDTTGTAQHRDVPVTDVPRQGETATAAPAQQQQAPAQQEPAQDPISEAIDGATNTASAKDGEKGKVSTASAKVEQSAPNRYKVNQAGFLAAIRATPEFKSKAGIFAGAVPDSTILEGFNNDPDVQAAGVRYDPATGQMHFKNPNDPKVKAIMAGFDTKSFMTPIEEKKKEQPKKVEPSKTEPKVEASVTTQPTPTDVPKTEASKSEYTPGTPAAKAWDNRPKFGGTHDESKPLHENTQPAAQHREVKATDVPKQGEKPKTEATPAPQAPSSAPTAPPPPEKKDESKPPVPKNKTGGKVRVDEGLVTTPIPQQESDPRSDNMLAINPKSQESLFTFNNKERLAYSPKNDQVQVVPENKIGTQQDPITASAQASNKIGGPITAAPQMPMMVQQNMEVQQNKNNLANNLNGPLLNYNRDPDMINTMMQHSGRIAKSPSAERAFSRAGFAETGSAIGGYHHSYGNSGTN